MLNNIKSKIYGSESFRNLKEKLQASSLFLRGINGSFISFLADYFQSELNRKIIIISNEPDKISLLKDDLDFISECENISVFRAEKNSDNEETTKSLSYLTEYDEFIVIIEAGSLSRKILTKDKFRNSLLELKKNDEYLFEELLMKLNEYRYEKKDFVEETGDYSVRGGIIDLFPENYDTPIRIEFSGETIDSIREFDINTQRSVRETDKIKIGINISTREDPEDDDLTGTIADYVSEDTLVIIDEPEIILSVTEAGSFRNAFHDNRLVFISILPSPELTAVYKTEEVNFGSGPQPDFHSNLKQLYSNVSGQLSEGYCVNILCSDEHQAERIRSLLEDYEQNITGDAPSVLNNSDINYLSDSIQSGFIFPESKITLYTEHQIFGRYFRQLKRKRKKFKGLTFEEIKELRPGDYIVHRDFGIGIFSGLRKIKVGNNEQEVVRLAYAGGDTLFLNMNYVNLIKKYSAGEGVSPALTRIGGGEWDKIKERAKKKVKDIARDLIILYAKRKTETGFSFSPDAHWQKELEASFIYEDTPDQFRATVEVKQDMENINPMDRLICGDVGFGKTEVAVRAAFKAVLDNKQVAILVPTTILAVQHFNTFRDRLSPYAVEVECISRLNSKKDQKEILKKLEDGVINIIIGTHRILSKDIKLKDLGLLVIDEEQRFGVKAKEKLRAIKPNVDTLTLTATPIPRTLNFSLLGARDLSVINTPPKNRKPIQTEIINFDWNLLTEIIRKEIQRKGQVYFVNDKIQELYLLADKLKECLPSVKAGIAHGQIEGNELEDIVVSFIEKKIDVLFCTKIIESGLDIPNVNTIIINNANMYGLSELYQLRGRVGRSDVQAYAYFISPPVGKLTKTAIRRLQAIEEYTDLGSGFNLAMRDMEIRGVGNLLGREQSGFISQVGFETYIDIIDEAVAELKENEFSELFKDEKSLKKIGDSIIKKTEYVSTVLESDLNAYIPKEYVENDTERLNIYKRLYEINESEKLNPIKEELTDRFGKYGSEVENLLKQIELKILATNAGLEKITIREKSLVLFFPANKEHKIFESDFFTRIIGKLSTTKSGKYNFINDDERLIMDVKLESTDDESRLLELQSVLNL
ncbi:MAG: transcription-repair coupling factor [Ignavibacteriae bacterium]|nr:transcription-repair coupling factor [Ignavibacteriota bacterium]